MLLHCALMENILRIQTCSVLAVKEVIVQRARGNYFLQLSEVCLSKNKLHFIFTLWLYFINPKGVSGETFSNSVIQYLVFVALTLNIVWHVACMFLIILCSIGLHIGMLSRHICCVYKCLKSIVTLRLLSLPLLQSED